MNDKNFFSANALHMAEFISFKRSLGFKYIAEEIMLLRFDRFLLTQDQDCIGLSKQIADKWCERQNNEAELTRYFRIVCILQFANYLRDSGIKAYLPVLPKYPKSTFIPHIYTHDEITAMLKACDNLRLKLKNMRSCLFVMPCLLRMLYATGIRIGEALSLKNKDININDKYLTLRGTKNTKDRYIPFTDTLAATCKEYLQYRNALPVIGLTAADKFFFVSLIGARCYNVNIQRWFREILITAKIPINPNGIGPRLHDVRHCFACHSFIKLAEDGMDLYCSWPYISTYLGHQSLRATEQYVRLTTQLFPDLIKDADKLYVDILPNIIYQ
jgi:integrase